MLHTPVQACTNTGTDLAAGDVLVSCCEGGVVTVWNPDEGKALHTLREHSADIEAVEWCPGQQHLLATASQDFSVR